jgi:hypothetical protein
MKTKLLTLLLSVFAYCTVFGQSLEGESNPCPGQYYTYEITLANTEPIPVISNFSNCEHPVTLNPTPVGSLSTKYSYQVKWNNVYVGANEPKSFVQVSVNKSSGSVPYKKEVTIKGLSDVQFLPLPEPSCAFRGNILVKVGTVANATSYTWTNTASWGGNTTTTAPSNTFNVTNESAANITVVARNENCPSSGTKNNTVLITRPAVAVVPVFPTTTPKAVCSGTTAAVSVTVAEGTPTSYEWYTEPSNYIGINGGNYTSDIPLSTTTPNVTLSYIGPATGGQQTSLFCRAVYSATCKTQAGYTTFSTGKPAVQMFSAFTTTLGEVFGDSFGACPIEVLQIRPVTNYGTGAVTGHQWEMLSGSYSSVSNLTGIPLRLRMSSQLDAEVEFRYRFNTACGWSEWLNCYAFTWSCNGARTAVITEKTAAAPTNPLSFTISPNPAANEISVNIPDTKSNTELLLNIVDIKGTSLIRSKHAAASKVSVDISKLPAGQYILQVQSGANSYSKQFIIAK